MLRTTTGRRPRRCWRSSCGRTRYGLTGRSRATASAIPGGSRSTAGPVTCTSGTSDRTTARRSTTGRTALRPRTTAGRGSRAAGCSTATSHSILRRPSPSRSSSTATTRGVR
jgi:hypothetical protein